MSRGFKSTADFLPYRNWRSEIQGICMTSEAMDWDEEIPDDPEEEYLALVRALKRKKGFGLFFIRCSQKEGKQIIERVKQDIPQKTIEVLRFIEPIDNLYNRVANLANRDKIDILFIQGIEYSLYEYELKTFGEITELYFNNFTSVPRILSHLNQQRERFRDDFSICFVFLLCPFAIKYFIQRAPDFFDWKSAIFDFPTHPDVLEEESSRLLLEGDYEEYLKLTPQERVKKIIEIQDLLAEDYQTSSCRVDLLVELGDVLVATKEYEGAIASFDQVLKLNPDKGKAWYGRGYALGNLGRYSEALASFDQALKLNPNNDLAWNNRGSALENLGRYSEALASFDQALELKPENDLAWYNQGVALEKLGRYSEALASCDQALKLKPENDSAWNNRGAALGNLGRHEEAIASYDQALKLKPENDSAWNNRGNALGNLGRHEEAIASYDQALKLKPENDSAWNSRGVALEKLGRYEEALVSYDQALRIKPDLHEAWNRRGWVMHNLGQYEKAIASYDQALRLQPNQHHYWNNRGATLNSLGRYEEAIANYDTAIAIKPDFDWPWINRGRALITLGRLKEGIASRNKAQEINPELYQAELNQLITSVLRKLGWKKLTHIVKEFFKLIGFRR